MEQTFLTGINIKKVRHLSDISIPLSDEKRKHLILTGKNGSGKTSVMEAIVGYFIRITSTISNWQEKIHDCRVEISVCNSIEFLKKLEWDGQFLKGIM